MQSFRTLLGLVIVCNPIQDNDNVPFWEIIFYVFGAVS